ncbi:S-adenosyl-L-methionine-dependent methyltransferase [Ophiobolus disseminans]|uniref:S-adenosyl-L-methionine-dependent methyltransferase n=1 Tax=Ophiobolus disseminans TaxID=1469910 RepID=A0A6A6ZZ58_9PLEO|nr:S-adenosyl-L-methionine-dependent methyltransferase [Ophiobolus disseminans]
MPRIGNSLLRKAHALDPFLPALLAPCRDIHAAQNELRWLRQHVDRVAKARRARGDTLAKGSLLRQLVSERASGKPLQYILGTEYFGDLEIRCRSGVLIPRQDTAASVTNLVRLLRDAQKLPPELRLLDLCTGTGCVPLLFRHELYTARDDVDLHILGVDVSPKALKLAHYNMQRAHRSMPRGKMRLIRADVVLNPFADQDGDALPLKVALNHSGLPPFWDILVSNPPYISPSNYWTTTTRSVRGYEPKLALVPPSIASQSDTEQGDLFYPRLLEIARDVEAKIVLLEVADLDQAQRVAQRAHNLSIFDGIEIWRERPDINTQAPAGVDNVSIIGEGNARSVLCWRGAGAAWLGKATASAGRDDALRLFRSYGHLPHGDASQAGTSPMEPQFDWPTTPPSEQDLPMAFHNARIARRSRDRFRERLSRRGTGLWTDHPYPEDYYFIRTSFGLQKRRRKP